MKPCDFCKKRIAGKYWQYEQKIFCDTCYTTSKKCTKCSVPTQKGIKQNDRIYCLSCTQKVKRCSYCRKHMFAKYWQIQDDTICDPCYKKYPKCCRCQIPSRDILKVKNQNICVNCAKKVDYCAKCRIPLLEKIFQFANDQRKFCSICVKSKDRCDICTIPITQNYFQIGDKRNICEKCMKTAVKTPTEAKKILQKVIAFLNREFQMKINLSTKLELVDALTLSKLKSKSLINYGSKDKRALGLFIQKGTSYNVYVETLLPYALCMGVLAHEYTHAWQADHFKKKASLLILEGLAEWISYKTLIHYGYKNQADTIPHQKDIYGQGFAKIIQLEKKYGSKNVLTKLISMVNR